MVISGTNSGCFCRDFGSVVLSDITGKISVSYLLYLPDNTQTSITEYYTPDNNGDVHINDLGTLILSYFSSMPINLSDACVYDLSILMEAQIFDESGERLNGFSQRFYYSNCHTSISAPYKYRGFLSRHRRRKILPNQAHFIGFFQKAQQLGIGVSYRSGTESKWTEFVQDVADTGYLYYRNLSLDTVVSLLQSNTDIIVSPEDVFYFIVYLKADGQVVDAMQLDIDRTHYPAVSHFVYRNCFGVPDTLQFVGKDNRTSEMEATYVNIQRQYRKINTKYNVYHDINSGYINDTLRDCVEDLVNSDVFLYDNTTLGERVTITETAFDESRPRTEPINVRLKYRLARECQRTIDRDMTLDYRIFDHTFGDTFE